MESTASPEIAVTSLGWIVMFAVCVVVLGFFGYGHRARWICGPIPTGLSLSFVVISEATWLGIPVVVAIVFAGIWAQTQPAIWNSIQPATNSSSRSDQSSKIQATSNVLQSVNSASPRETFGNRPAWVAKPRTKEGLAERVVLSSGQYSTTAEAEGELLGKVGELVYQDLQHVNSMSHGGAGWRPSDDEVKRFAVKQQYVEVTETDFGKFQHPMHRLWWQVELSPSVRAEFLPSWRRDVLATRIQWVGIGASSLALMATLIRVYLRMLSLTNGKHRVALTTVAGGISTAWLMLAWFVSQGRIW